MNTNNPSLGNLSTPSPTRPYCPLYEPDSDLVKEIKKAAYFLVVSIGIFGNIFVIIATARFKVSKNIHYLVINMAVSDLLFLVLKTYTDLYYLTGVFDESTHPEPGVMGDIVCKTKAFLFRVSFRVSLATLLVISIERFRATRKTLQRSRPYTLKQKLIIIGICWLIPVAVYSPFLAMAKMDVDLNYCEAFHETVKLKLRPLTYLLSWGSAFFTVIIIAVEVVLSVLTIRRLYKFKDKNITLMERWRRRRAKRIKAAVGMVLVSLIPYTVCWLPYHIWYFLKSLNLWSWQYAGKDLIELFPYCKIGFKNFSYMVGLLLPVLNSSVSPYIYVVFLSEFRSAARKLFFCRRFVRKIRADEVDEDRDDEEQGRMEMPQRGVPIEEREAETW